MPELLEKIYRRLVDDRAVEKIATNRELQFGTEDEPLIGADFLPERLDSRDQWRENFAGVIRGFVADDTSAYSPPQIKASGLQTGGFQIEQGSIKIASEFTAADIEALIHQSNFSEDAVYLRVLDWINQALALAAHRKSEIQRWQAFVRGTVRIAGMDQRLFDIAYPNPMGYRRVIPSGTLIAPAGWYLGTYDPIPDITAVKSILARKGRRIVRVVGDDTIIAALRNNDTMKDRVGGISITAAGTLTTFRGEIEKSRLDTYFEGSLQLPPIEEYNTVYTTQDDRSFAYKEPGSLVFFTKTMLREPYPREGTDNAISNTVGYYARGRARGEIEAGLKIRIKYRDIDPVGIYGESLTAGIPVVQDPHAIASLIVPAPIAA